MRVNQARVRRVGWGAAIAVLLTLILAICLLYHGVRFPGVRPISSLLLAAGIFLAMIVLMPARMFGSAFADIRLWPIFFIVGLTAMAPVDPTWRGAPMIAGGALAVFAVRIVVTAFGFAG